MKMKTKREETLVNKKTKVAALMMALLLNAVSVWGSVTGSISGTVTDPTGGVVPGTTVVAINTETGIQNSARANEVGFYSFPALPAGHYDVRIRASGFQEYRQTGLLLEVNSAVRVDATLRVGALTQEVRVSATAVHVETSNTQMGEVIGGTKMTTLPLNGRSYTDLLALQPGVAPVSSGESGANGVSGNLNAGGLSISGQRETANGFMINGGSAQEKMNMVTSIIPNLDSIEEFRILTNNATRNMATIAAGWSMSSQSPVPICIMEAPSSSCVTPTSTVETFTPRSGRPCTKTSSEAQRAGQFGMTRFSFSPTTRERA